MELTTNCWETVAGGVVGSFTAVYDFKIISGSLIAVGPFNQMGGQSINSVARWDGTQWYDLGYPRFVTFHSLVS